MTITKMKWRALTKGGVAKKDRAQAYYTINRRSRGAQHTSEHTKERSLIPMNKHTDNAQSYKC